MLNYLENTFKLQFDSYVTDAHFFFKTTWLELIPTLQKSVYTLGWNTVKLFTGMQKKPFHSLGFCTEFVNFTSPVT